MLKALIKKQITEIFRSYYYDSKKNKARSKGGVIAYFLLFAFLMIGVVGAMFIGIAKTLCSGLAGANMDWLYFTIMGGMSIFLGIFGSVFNTQATLYKAKDNDLLLSMPIPVHYVLLSRLAAVLCMSIMYSWIIIIPTEIVFFMQRGFAAPWLLGCAAQLIIIPLLVSVLTCLLGFVVAKIGSKLKNKSIASVLVSLIGLGLYYFFYYRAQVIIQDIVAHAAEYGAKIKGSAYALYLFGRVGEGNPLAVAVYSAAALLLCAVTLYVLTKSFLKITTAGNGAQKRKENKADWKSRSAFGTLLNKEFKKFTATPNYMLNCGLGILILPAAGVFLLIKGNTFISSLIVSFEGRSDTVPVLFCAAAVTVNAMIDTAAPSVSLEGKGLWQLQALPVRPWDVLKAKAGIQILLGSVPMLFCGICGVVIIPATLPQKVLLVVFPLIATMFSAFFGLFFGLKMPTFGWTNEIVPIKQSAAVTIALFGMMLLGVAMGAAYLAVGYRVGATAFLAAVAALFAVATALLIGWMKKKGSAVFAAL